MPTPIPRRRAVVLLLACAPVLRASAGTQAGSGLQIAFVIVREARQPSGDITRRSFENAMLLVGGEPTEIDFRDQYRVRLAATDNGASATVKLKLWDNLEDAIRAYAGDGTVQVPIGGQANLKLLKSDNITYSVAFTATRRALPGG